jgi:hypothetical protein
MLFIDEIHTLVGAGAGEGAMDAANILKPALAKGELRAIGATTLNEYQKYFERIKPLKEEFQVSVLPQRRRWARCRLGRTKSVYVYRTAFSAVQVSKPARPRSMPVASSLKALDMVLSLGGTLMARIKAAVSEITAALIILLSY